MKANYSESDVIWRYMDLSKLLSLFDMRKLFLSQISKFEDKYEGFYPVKDFIDPNDEFYSVISEKMVNELISVLKSGFYANCWHINKDESFAMWKIYSNKGIAIKTTVGNLKNSLRENNKKLLLFGGVEYLDYHKQSINDYVTKKRNLGIYIPMLPVFFKRKEFDFEKEFRIVSIKRPNHTELKELNLKEKFQKIISSAETSIKIDTNLDELIQEIYVSPFAEKWYHDLVSKLAK